MPEEMMKNGKSVILLRSFCLLSVVLFLFSAIAFPASAVVPKTIYDYNDLISEVVVDGNNDIVTLNLPVSSFWIGARDLSSSIWLTKRIGSYLSYSQSPNVDIIAFPLGYQNDYQLDVTNIPAGTTCDFAFAVDVSTSRTFDGVVFLAYYYDSNGEFVAQQDLWRHDYGLYEDWETFDTATLEIPNGAASCCLRFEFINFHSDSSASTVRVSFDSFKFKMSISSLYRQQQLTGKTNALLEAVQDQLAEQGKTMEDILEQQQQTNDKIDELPGEIGDEMQDVIDSEKEESKEEGNKFVDQILDALPDPSTDVLAALKSLTDSTAYTGTDAVLPIPAIVLPGIDGLFSQTEIWGGTDFDFGEYIQLLPTTLLTLVQALFTIAIVIYCVYELKGIISYCLTLRENKGG